MTKTNWTIKNKKIKDQFYEDSYKVNYEAVCDMELQNEWLGTAEGKREHGTEKCEQLIKRNDESIKMLKYKLRALRKKVE